MIAAAPNRTRLLRTMAAVFSATVAFAPVSAAVAEPVEARDDCEFPVRGRRGKKPFPTGPAADWKWKLTGRNGRPTGE